MLSNSKREKRRWIIGAIALFLVFDFSVLALNYWLSWKIENEAAAINLAGRQRMLTQRMVKSLLQIEMAAERGIDPKGQLSELQSTFSLFDNTLQGFDHGHLTNDGNNQPVFLEPLQDKAQRTLLDETKTLWQPYRIRILALLANAPDYKPNDLSAAAAYANENNLALLDLMNQLTSNLQSMSHRQTEQIRIYQSLAFLLALINFFAIFLIYNQRIRKASRSSRMLDNVINKVAVSVLIIDADNRVIDSNLTARQLFQYDKDEMTGKVLEQFLDEHENETSARRKDGSSFMAQVERNQMKLDKQVLTLLTITDITRQRMTEARLNEMAYHDMLTGLPNRILFDDRLGLEISHVRRDNNMLAVMFIDLDNFKPINDTYGHHAGDLLLKEITRRIRQCLREIDTVSRRGGDEFTVILSSINNVMDSEKVANNILQQLAIPFPIGGQHIMAGASIGISLYPQLGKTVEQLLLQADAAMYLAKAAGGNQIRVYVENAPLVN